MTHGSLTVSVPKNIFKGDCAVIDQEKAKPFREILKSRYPWLSDNSLDVLMESARKIMVSILDEETNGRSLSRYLDSQGKTEEAIMHLKRYLEKDPENADSWYALGELLCKVGRAEEGYKAF
ncbi:MAG: tetratricopeptide repeat protein, partial [Candidatus Methanoplasma sp.]|nr:tetratricopeptide repeat protein [Candidatus Methanoplasma sp.]